ncbi:MAG: hypothetical protein RRB13_00855 [bacterium]|nr:hypothetical protein [bacterium]
MFEPLAERMRKGPPPTEAERLRVEQALKVLERWQSKWQHEIPSPCLVDFKSNTGALVKQFGAFIAPMVEVLSRVRMIEWLVGQAYETRQDDLLFANMGWKQLSDEELSLCPPFVVYTDFLEDWAAQAGDLYALLAKGVPFKVVVFQDHINFHQFEEGRAIATMAHPDLGFLGLGLRNAYVVKLCAGLKGRCDQELMGALQTNRPALVSIYEGPDDAADELALASRAFPYMRYDPDQGFAWSSCLDLGSNPSVEQPWVIREVPNPERSGETMQLPLTFAHFAFGVENLKNQFVKLELPGPNDLTLVEYFNLAYHDRLGKRPYIWAGQPLERWLLSENLLSQTQDKARLWYSLQTLVGIYNPHAAAQQAQGKVTLENQRALDSTELAAQRAELNEEYELQLEKAREEAMRIAFDRVTERLKHFDKEDLRAQLRALPELEVFLLGMGRS